MIKLFKIVTNIIKYCFFICDKVLFISYKYFSLFYNYRKESNSKYGRKENRTVHSEMNLVLNPSCEIQF